MFLVTAYVGSTTPMPFDRWGTRHHGRADTGTWLPLGWEDVDACVRSGLVEFGGHSHRHVNAAVSSPAEVREEAEQSREILRLRLGDAHAQCYAYPYGSRRLGQVTPEYVDAVRRSGYALAVSTNLGLASAASPPYELPRVEVDRSDGPAVVKAKVAGSLAPYSLTERLRRARRN
jgi:peptidoglycan/xylan/chitin deacetylase (PgdA/CDA1 family)